MQYASVEYIDELNHHGFEVSVARMGNPYENAIMESLLKTLKYDEVYLCDYGGRDRKVSLFHRGGLQSKEASLGIGLSLTQ